MFPVVFRSVGDIFVFLDPFLSATSPECPEYRGLYSSLSNHLLIVDERLFVVMGFKLKSHTAFISPL